MRLSLVLAPLCAAFQESGGLLVETLELRAEKGTDDAVPAPFRVRIPEAGILYVRASSADCDPDLRARVGGASFADEDGGGGTTAQLELVVRAGDEVELLVGAREVPGVAAADVRASLASDVPGATELAREVATRVTTQLSADDALACAERMNVLDPEAHSPALIDARWRLAEACRALGPSSYELEARLRAGIHAYWERHLPPTHTRRLDAAARLALVLEEVGRGAEALALEQGVVDVRRELLADDDPQLLASELNLGSTLFALGELERASATFAEVVERTALSAKDDPLALAARQNQAAVWLQLGRVGEAAARFEELLAALAVSAPAGLGRLRGNHALCLLALGRPEEALTSLTLAPAESANASERWFLQLLEASARAALGDLAGARVLQERVLRERSAELASDVAELDEVRAQLADTLTELGELAPARALLEQVLAAQSVRLPADHPNLASTRLALSKVLSRSGLDREAAELCRLLLASLPVGEARADLELSARSRLAWLELEQGELATARARLEELLASRSDWPEAPRWRGNLAWVLMREGDAHVGEELARFLDQAEARLASFGPQRSAREVEALVLEAEADLAQALSLLVEAPAGLLAPEFEGRMFALAEATRAVGAGRRRMLREFTAQAAEPELAALEQRRQAAQAELVRRSLDGRELFEATRARDEAERALFTALARRPGFAALVPDTDPAAIARALAPGEAALGYWRYERTSVEPASGRLVSAPHYLAWVLVREQALVRVELGPAVAIEAAAERWRAALLKGIPRGIGAGQADEEDEAAAAVRRLVWEPLEGALGAATTVWLAPDAALHALPFEALPARAGGLLGDERRLVLRESLKGLTRRRPAGRDAQGLVVMGGMDFDRAPEGARASSEGPAETPRLVSAGAFRPLLASESEARTIAHEHERAFAAAARELRTGPGASRAAFEALAPRATYLHLATHARFAAPGQALLGDASTTGYTFQTRADELRGFAPLSLSALAFSGANLAQSDGRRLELLTAEELAGLDLARCELAVLSACETALGVVRAGQGVASLQSALAAAGARTTITSLWRVPDQATNELMQAFYRELWLAGRSKADALRAAKRALRDERDAAGRQRYATSDWAAWVLAGEP